MTGSLHPFVAALLLTLAVEVPLIALLGARMGVTRRTLVAAVLINTLTNPVAILAIVASSVLVAARAPGALPVAVVAVEAAVVATEWFLLRATLGWPSRRSLAVSLIVNAASFGVGLAVL